MKSMFRIALLALSLGLAAGTVSAKLPPLSEEAQAKAAEAKSKAADSARIAADQLAAAQDRVAAAWKARTVR